MMAAIQTPQPRVSRMAESFRCLYASARQWCTLLLVLLVLTTGLEAQERRAKLRISNAGFTITALPLLAAKDWGLFTANGLAMEVIPTQSALAPAALTQGDIDYQAGVGPASVNATMSGFATRALWVSTERTSHRLRGTP